MPRPQRIEYKKAFLRYDKKIRDWLNTEQTVKTVIAKQAKSNGPMILTATNKERTEHCPKCKTGYLYLIGEILSERERRRFS